MQKRITFSLIIICLFFSIQPIIGQNLPSEFSLTVDGKILSQGDRLADGLYDRNIIREVRIDFPQSNYWTLLTNNYESETDIVASLTIDGVTYDSVGVRFRGNTSYTMTGSSQKKSFAISTDIIREDQDILGYKNLKFNNAHQDASFMREVLYYRMAKKYIPIAKANYIHLFLNNEDWGVYPNVQAIDKTFLEQWFLSNDGPRFRATVEDTGPGPGGWGDGTAGMNFLSADTNEYKQYYELKSSDIEDPWQKLTDACEVLNDVSMSTIVETYEKLDIDKILWFLAAENIFIDDDSYVMKGKMDYYVYHEPETGRASPLEYDGNSSMQSNLATSQNWGPFKNASNENYPLLNKLLNIPEWRQRYLAHYRTILAEGFTSELANAIIDTLDEQIKDLVAGDTKKLYSTSQYNNSVSALKNFVANRRNFLLTNQEVAQQGPQILSSTYFNQNLEESAIPLANEIAYVTAEVNSTSGIQKVNLYYDDGLVGTFKTTEMFDDGLHQDGLSNDGVFGGTIPSFPGGTLVRFYIEAIATNAALSAAYLPQGAEHDVFVYTVQQSITGTGIVINEILASNMTGAADEAGDNADWLELYNNNNFDVDLSGYYLSDDSAAPGKWQFADGTVIGANGYLIIWADDEEEEGNLHAGWKLAIEGEEVILSDAQLNPIDHVTFPQQTTDVAYARIPNGTGGFVFQAPTFSVNNEGSTAVKDVIDAGFRVYPNPFVDIISIEIEKNIQSEFTILDIGSRVVMHGILSNPINEISLQNLQPGQYILMLETSKKSFVRLIKI